MKAAMWCGSTIRIRAVIIEERNELGATKDRMNSGGTMNAEMVPDGPFCLFAEGDALSGEKRPSM